MKLSKTKIDSSTTEAAQTENGEEEAATLTATIVEASGDETQALEEGEIEVT